MHPFLELILLVKEVKKRWLKNFRSYLQACVVRKLKLSKRCDCFRKIESFEP